MHQEGCNDRYRLAPEKDVIVAQKQIWELQMMSTVATEPLASWWLKKKFVSEQEVHACTWEDVEHLNASESLDMRLLQGLLHAFPLQLG